MTEHKEIEVKFLINDLNSIERKLIDLKAALLHTQHLEQNYRFDTIDGKLTSESKVLRIRKDRDNWITYKAPGSLNDGIRSRQEIEFQISDIEAARSMLECLGFRIFQTYEKYRTVYILDDTKIMVDELPMGNFIEIEGDEVQNLKKIAAELNLQWERRIDRSYLSIFDDICAARGLGSQDLTFGTSLVDPEIYKRLNIFPADEGLL